MSAIKENLKEASIPELVQELNNRSYIWPVKLIDEFDDEELVREIEHRYLQDEFNTIDSYDTSELKAELSNRNIAIVYGDDHDKNVVIEKYYDSFTWTQLNHLFKISNAARNAGIILKQDFSMLEGEVIS